MYFICESELVLTHLIEVIIKISKYCMVGNHGSSPLKSMSFSTVRVKMSESV